MRKKKGARSEGSQEEDEVVQVELQQQIENEEGNGFFACYLLASLNPRFKGHTYIGFTVNPRRRIRQHNGEIGSGAWRTKRKRPWEMVLCIYGFPTNVSALQFEWAWQHPVESLAVRKAAVGFKSLSGIANKIKLAYTMLTLPSWQSMNITVNFFSTKYTKHCAGCPKLPEHMNVEIGSMDELPCYTERIEGLSENEDDRNFNEVEFDDNNTSTSGGSVPDASDDSITTDSSENPNHMNKVSEPSKRNKESEAREPPPGHSVSSQEESQPFGSITSPIVKSSPLARVGVIEDAADFMRSTYKSNAELSQPDSQQSGGIDVPGAFIVPHEADIIDLSTPSPSCRSILDRKKRRVSSSAPADFIDLTNSPNFIQL